MQRLLWCILAITSTVSGLKDQRYQYEIKSFEVPVDHFSYTTNATFKIRYLINSRYSTDTSSPILFYPGNEANIELFAQNTGFIWEAASKLSATVIFAEHRYYGESLPFGDESFKSPTHLGHLTSEQALADFADLLDEINPQPKPPLNRRPVIAIGGSYGGRLAAWFRMKYPHIVAGAVASSAPIFQYKTPCDVFYRIVSSVFEMAYKGSCATNIRHLWVVLNNLINTVDGRQSLENKFKLCDPKEVDNFMSLVDNALVKLAIYNYPYATNVKLPLPAYPVREFCSRMSGKYDDDQLIEAFHEALQVFGNFSGSAECLQLNDPNDEQRKIAWRFQTCTELIDPICSTGVKDIFWPSQWTLQSHSDECFRKFGVRPRENAIATNFGGKRLESASNIIFSNGLMDPWSGGGVLRTTNSLVQIVIIPEGAHHLDIRASNEKDPLSVRQARRFYIEMIKRWIKKHA